jgi:2-C-methyl-D-erythritol 4-phosphate cytidylyltransferase
VARRRPRVWRERHAEQSHEADDGGEAGEGCVEDDRGQARGASQARRAEDCGEARTQDEGAQRVEVSVWAVLAAAGSGERLGADRPKAFVRLGEQPLLAESLGRLDGSDWIDAIVVAAPPGWEEPAILLAEELGCGKVSACVTGGATRAESVRLGVAEVPAEAAVILVHDAARPLLDDAVVERVVNALGDGWDGAVPALPIADTVKRVDGERIVETLERDELRTVQTPQGFVADVLRGALASGSGWTDCAAAVEAAGGRVRVVAGDPRLLKVTDAADLGRAAALL